MRGASAFGWFAVVGLLTLVACTDTPPDSGTGGAAGSGAAGSGAAGVGAAGAGAESALGGAGGTEAEVCDEGTGTALAFRGDVIDLVAGDLGPDLPGGNAPRTVELWAHFTGEASWVANHTVIELGRRVDGFDQVFGLDLAGRDGENGVFGPYTNDSGDNDPTPLPLPAEGWYHLAWGYDGAGHFQLVVNGVLVPLARPGDGTAVLATTPGIVTLGGSQNFGWEGWEGAMDELRLWTTFRTEAEIARDMKIKLNGSEPGLAAYYDFDRGSGMTIDDVLKTPGHKLTFCPDNGGPCPSPNAALPTWVESDIPGPFTCAE
jgi:hypothetical protein